MTPSNFAGLGEFVDRQAELDRLQRWWLDEEDRLPLILYGRRRTGKSWLLRAFAHGKDADIFVCDTRAEGDQLAYFGGILESSIGVRPELPDVRSFYRLLYRHAASARRLVVIDEFPLLLATTPAADSVLAATLEEEMGSSRLKLVLCGSQIATMQTLLAERAPLHGRGTPMLMRPLPFEQAALFLRGHRLQEAITRYAVAGGMPLYLRRLGRRTSLLEIICEDLLEPLGPLFDEAREVLAMELTSTATHFSLLSALSGAPSLAWEEIVRRSRVEESVASRYIRTLEDLHIVDAANPMFALPQARRRRYRVRDPFMRFWFRFVFPYQADLAAGLRPGGHYDRNIAPHIADHVSPVFEEVCRSWVRSRYAATDTVGSWWGPARHDLRRQKVRSTEEIDVVGARGSKVTVVGECRWKGRPMKRDVLDDLLKYKLPALAQSGVDVSSAAVALFSRTGFSAGLRAEASRLGHVELVDLSGLVATA